MWYRWWFHHTLSDLTPAQLDYSAPALDDRPLMEVAMQAATILLGRAMVEAGKNWPMGDYPLNRWPPRLARPASAAVWVLMILVAMRPII